MHKKLPTKNIVLGAKVIFYKAGSKGKVFLGYANIKSKADQIDSEYESFLSISTESKWSVLQI